MKRSRNRLLILLAILTIGTAPFSRTALGDMRSIPEGSTGTTSLVGPFTGDPDIGQTTKSTTQPHSASQVSTGEDGSRSAVVPRAMWVSAVVRIWAAMHWGVGQ